MNRLLSLFLSAALALSLAACGGPPPAESDPPSEGVPPNSGAHSGQRPIEIPFALAAYPAYSFHPALAENRANLTLAPLLYEPLFQLDEAFQAVPVLCRSYSVSEDRLTWTFALQSGVTFSNGAPLTGPVVSAALELARQSSPRYAGRLRDVTSISAGESTVTLTLSRPNGALPTLLDIPIALDGGERPLGTGPYVLSGQADELTLEARPDWWQGSSLPVASIPLVSAQRSDELISAFAAGNIGLVDVDLMGTNALGYSGSYETWDYATTDLLYLGFNTQSGPCRDPAVRRILSRAVDRESIVQIDFARHAKPAVLPIHPDHVLYDDALAQTLDYSPTSLGPDLKASGAAGHTVTLLVNSENSAKVSAAQRIAYQLESAGLRVNLSKLPFESYTAALSNGSFDLYLGEVVLTADFDLSALLSPGASLNYGRWEDWTVPDLLARLRSAEGVDRTPAAAALFAYLNDQAPIAPICFKSGSVLTQWGRLTGLSPVRGNVFSHLEGWTIQ